MTPKSLWGLSILVADDEEVSRSMVARMARKLDAARVEETGDGAEALAALRAHGPVDIIVCDADMPGMNGLEFLKAIRTGAVAGAEAAPFVLMAGQGDTDLVAPALRLDVGAILVKPATFGVFAQRIARVLAEPRAIAEPSVYEAVDLSRDTAGRLDEAAAGHETDAPVRRLPLREVPANAVLARDVRLASGVTLVSAGQIVTDRLLRKLDDLRELDDSVAHLWIEG